MVAKIACLLLLVVVVAVRAQGTSRTSRRQDDHGYQFSYDIKGDKGGEHGREESGDNYGNKKGSYYLRGADGRFRKVNYVADKEGFRADIDTNEPGTKDSNVAAATYRGPGGVYDTGYAQAAQGYGGGYGFF